MPADAAPSGDPRPSLSTFDTTMVVVSLVIGIGIFRTPALVAGATGSAAWFLAAWVIGGAASLVGALVFAEIGSRYPRAGGFYKVVAHCWHPLAAFVLNWAQVLMQGAGAGGVALIGAEYLLRLGWHEGNSDGPPASVTTGLAAAMICGLVALNAAGIRAGARAQNILSVAKIVLIAGLAAAGWRLSAHPQAAWGATSAAGSIPPGLLAALVAVFYTYGGYQNTMNLAADVRESSRRLPLAIVGGMGIVMALYLAINVAYVRGLGPGGVAASPLVAADLSRAALGIPGQILVSLAIFLSAAGFVNATILQVPRGYLAMARDGLLPPALGRLDGRTQAQRAGLLFFAATALLPLLFLGSFDRLVAYVMFTDAVSLAVVASCLFVLRGRREGEGRQGSWSMPGYPWLPGLYLLALLGLAADLLARRTALALGGILVALAGVPLYLVMKRSWGASGGAAPAGSPPR